MHGGRTADARRMVHARRMHGGLDIIIVAIVVEQPFRFIVDILQDRYQPGMSREVRSLFLFLCFSTFRFFISSLVVVLCWLLYVLVRIRLLIPSPYQIKEN